MIKRARFNDYSDKLANEICETLACGTDSIMTLCDKNPHWPSLDVIRKWRINIPEFSAKYMSAKQHQIESIVDEILDIADDTSKDVVISGDNHKYDHDHISRTRIKIDTRKWLAAKLVPRLYGEKLNISADDNNNFIGKVRENLNKYEQE